MDDYFCPSLPSGQKFSGGLDSYIYYGGPELLNAVTYNAYFELQTTEPNGILFFSHLVQFDFIAFYLEDGYIKHTFSNGAGAGQFDNANIFCFN